MTDKCCRYCNAPALLVHAGQRGYPYYGHDFGPMWVCVPCKAWVGCHTGTTKALGGLANAELRKAKVAAHEAFDPLWQRKMVRDGCTKRVARNAGYAWLAGELGIPVALCHIGYMSLEECNTVVDICETIRKTT